MPIVQTATGLVYFAHVPKCAGSAIENYLQKRFGPLAFMNRRYLAVRQKQRWTKTSPQHVTADALAQLFPDNFFAAQFAVVRHPVQRLRSVFLFQRDIEEKLPLEMVFADWLATLEETWAARPFALDNHTRPMTDFIPENATIFPIEAGLGAVVDWLDALTQTDSEPRQIPQNNALKGRLKQLGKPAAEIEITQADIETIQRLYAADFERFGYDTDMRLEERP